MTNILYKYRDLNNFKFIVDILINNRLYAAKYSELNDPMEGIYYYNGLLTNEQRNRIFAEKGQERICSLSRVNNNFLMWSHYADGHKGIVLGIKVIDNNCVISPIQYDELLHINNIENQTAIDILSHKHYNWSYEQEIRVFKRREFVKIKIEEIIFGRRTTNENKELLTRLVQRINPGINIIDANNINFNI